MFKVDWRGLRKPDFRRRFWRERKQFLAGCFGEDFKNRLKICWRDYDSMVQMNKYYANNLLEWTGKPFLLSPKFPFQPKSVRFFRYQPLKVLKEN